VAEARKRHRLNPKQLHILRLHYKFRFITIPLLTTYKNLKSNSLHRTFDILREEKYIDRRFDSSYKIDRKPATYYLTTKGMAVLKGESRVNQATLHSFYKNKSVSDAFMQHAVDTLEVYNILKQAYKDRFEIFTRQEVMQFNEFPKTKPDLYLRGDREYFVSLVHDLPQFLIKKRLAEYITHSDEDGWLHGDYPTLLFVCADESAARRVLKFAETTLEDAGIEEEELRIGVTTTKALRTQQVSRAIWMFTGAGRAPSQFIE
jgi:DNA-binding MarR family transcriptional regulator